MQIIIKKRKEKIVPVTFSMSAETSTARLLIIINYNKNKCNNEATVQNLFLHIIQKHINYFRS